MDFSKMSMWYTERNFENPQNYFKVNLLYTLTGGKVLLKVIDWLYKGRRPPETYLIILAEDKKNGIKNHEKVVLKMLEEKKLSLEQTDFSVLFLVAKLTCGLTSFHDPVWSKDCPPGKENCLEQYLYVLKEGRNEIAHVQGKIFSISDDEVDRRSKMLETIYFSVLEQAGVLGKVKKEQIDGVKKLIELDVNKITRGNVSEQQTIDALLKQDVEFSSKHEYPEYTNILHLDSPPAKKIRSIDRLRRREEEEEEEEEKDFDFDPTKGSEFGSPYSNSLVGGGIECEDRFGEASGLFTPNAGGGEDGIEEMGSNYTSNLGPWHQYSGDDDFSLCRRPNLRPRIPNAKVTSRKIYNTIDNTPISNERFAELSPYFSLWKDIYEK